MSEYGGGPGPGYPYQGPGYGQPAGPPAAPRKKGSTGLIVGILVAVLVLAAGAAVWLVQGAGASGKTLWSVPSHASGVSGASRPAGADGMDGVWFTDTAVVQAGSDRVTAYEKESGARLWEKPYPGEGSHAPCLAPAESFGDIGIVAYRAEGAEQPCDRLVAYDLTSGKELWQQRLAAPDDPSLARAGDVVVVGTGAGHKALKASDGSVAWDNTRGASAGCDGGAYTGGKNLVRLRSCSQGDPFDGGRNWNEVSLIDPATGKAEWNTRVKTGDAEQAVSTSPIVIRTESRKLYSVDEESGKLRHEFEGAAASYGLSSSDTGSPSRRVARVGDVFVMAGTHPGDPRGNRESMAAYDLNTGEQLWKRQPEAETKLFPAPASPASPASPSAPSGANGTILAYKSTANRAPELVEVDVRSGDMKSVLTYEEDVKENMSALARPFWDGGRIYVAALEGSLGDESYAMAALPTEES